MVHGRRAGVRALRALHELTRAALVLLVLAAGGASAQDGSGAPPRGSRQLALPDGYQAEVVARGLRLPQDLAADPPVTAEAVELKPLAIDVLPTSNLNSRQRAPKPRPAFTTSSLAPSFENLAVLAQTPPTAATANMEHDESSRRSVTDDSAAIDAAFAVMDGLWPMLAVDPGES